MRILIVDDSKYQRFLIQSLLSGYGACDEATDGAQGVEMFRLALELGRPYGLVVLDILMPLMDGHTALRQIIALQDAAGVAEGARAKALMLSTLDDPQTMLTAQFESGADMFLTKPFEGSTLIEAFENLCLAPEADEADGDEPCLGLCPAPGTAGGRGGAGGGEGGR